MGRAQYWWERPKVRPAKRSDVCGADHAGLDLQWTGDPQRWIVPKSQVGGLQVYFEFYSAPYSSPWHPVICDPAKQILCFDFRNQAGIEVSFLIERQQDVPYLMVFDSGPENAIGTHTWHPPTIAFNTDKMYAKITATYAGSDPFWVSKVAAWASDLSGGSGSLFKWSAYGNFTNPLMPSWGGKIAFLTTGLVPTIPLNQPPVRVSVAFFTAGYEVANI